MNIALVLQFAFLSYKLQKVEIVAFSNLQRKPQEVNVAILRTNA